MFLQVPVSISTPSASTPTFLVEESHNVPMFIQFIDGLNKYAPLLGLIFLVGGAIFAGFKLWGKILEAKMTLKNLSDDISQLSPVVARLNKCVVELQTTMRSRYRTLSLVHETLDFYGERNSPIVLKDEYRDYIQRSGLASEIEEKKSTLVQWLRSKKPKTGLDAQEAILDLVFSDKIEKKIDTTEYKKQLYESGKSARDYYLILSIYLFEVIIPEVIEES